MEVENGEDGRPVLGAGHETGVLVVLDAGSCNIKLRTRLKASHPDQGGRAVARVYAAFAAGDLRDLRDLRSSRRSCSQ